MHINLFNNNRTTGANAEKVAKDFLIKNGYLILETNFRTKVGEIDIIAYDKKVDCLIFVEVKYRSKNDFGLPQESVTKNKQKKIINTAFVYLKNINKKYNNYRFDVLSISYGNKVEHIKNAFCLD
ncbi:MAG: YraN family protein [Endomicrobiia bacterium]